MTIDQQPNFVSKGILVALGFLILLIVIIFFSLPRPTTSDPGITHETPTDTSTATPIATATIVPTTTNGTAPNEPALSQSETPITPTATITPVPAPKNAENLRLKIWSFSDAQETINDLERIITTNEYSQNNEAEFSLAPFLYETLLRFPSENARDLKKHLIPLKYAGYISNESGPIHNRSVEPFRQELETALNTNEATFDHLERWDVSQFNLAIVGDPIATVTLFHSKDPAVVVQYTYQGGVFNTFVIRQNPDRTYTVIPLNQESIFLGQGMDRFEIRDVNQDGWDEIIVIVDNWGIGMTHFCSKEVFVLAWNGTEFANLLFDRLHIGLDTDFSTGCQDFTFTMLPNGKAEIIAEARYITECSDYPVIYQKRFQWNGSGFEQAFEEVLPFPDSGPKSCAIAWAKRADVFNDQAVQILTEAIKDNSADIWQNWGPAGKDYFSIKLATWLINRGQTEQGLALLKEVQQNPASPTYTFAKQVASTYLTTLESSGKYLAAKETQKFIYDEIEANSLCDYYMGYCYPERSLARWGFYDQDWGVIYGPDFADEFDRLFDLEQSVKEANLTGLVEIKSFLERNKFQILAVDQKDIDGDGSNDWLISVSNRRANGSEYTSTFAFLPTSTGISFYDLQRSYRAPEKLFRWITYRPSLQADWINVVQDGDLLKAFTITKNEGRYKERRLFSSIDIYYGDNRPLVTDFKIIDDPVAGQLLVVQYDGSQGIYKWDQTNRSLVPTGLSPELQRSIITEAEQALFFDGKPQQAQQKLTELLSQRVYDDYRSYSIRTRPYLLYLLGLAYELQDDEGSAITTYWQLWRDFPDSPFSMIIQKKFVLIP